MPTLTLTKNYADGTILFASDFTVFLSELEAFFNVTKIADSNISDSGITGSSVLSDASITTAKILDGNITTAKIADGEIGPTPAINALAVNSGKLDDLSVTAAKIADLAIDSSLIAAGVITNSEKVSNYVLTSGSGTSTQRVAGSVTTATLITNMQATITVVGNPIEIRCSPDTSTGLANPQSFLRIDRAAGDAAFPIIEIYRDSTAVMSMQINHDVNNGNTTSTDFPATIGPFLDDPGAGTYTYTIKARWSSSSGNIDTRLEFQQLRMLVREL